MNNKKENIDIESFEVITNQYAKDKNYIYLIDILKDEYYKLTKLNIDINSFEIIPNELIKAIDWPGNLYTKDKNGIYFLGDKINNIDIESFERVKNDFKIKKIYKDKNNIISDGKIITNIDVNSFVIFSQSYGKDKNNIIYLNNLNILKNSDINTFKAINIYSGEDKNNIYEKDKIISSKKENIFNKIKKKLSRLF